jgi:hypothetical protein
MDGAVLEDGDQDNTEDDTDYADRGIGVRSQLSALLPLENGMIE